MRTLLLAAALWAVASPVVSMENSGTVTIPVEEYEELKKASEDLNEKQYWNMTFAQILERERGDTAKAWAKYEYYVLRTIYLTGPVNSGSVGKIIGDMHVLNKTGHAPITLVFNSPGGSVFDGLNLYNAMMASKSPIHTVCDGMAASMAAILLSAGDHRVAKDACIFMVHEVAGGGGGGNTTHKVKDADRFISVENVLLRILSENTGLSLRDVVTLGEFETFWNADETLALGFVDEVQSGKPRTVTPGSRAIPAELLPKARIARQISERLTE